MGVKKNISRVLHVGLTCKENRMEIGILSDTNFYNPSNICARARLVKTRHVTQYAPTKIGEYPSDIPQFK